MSARVTGARVVRQARADDDAAIGELLVEAFVTGYARKMPEVVVTESRKRDLRDVATKRAEAMVLVAEDASGAVVGTVTLYEPGHAGSKAWLPGHADLRYLAIDPARRGQGIADAMIDEAFARAERLGWRGISLHVRRGAAGVARVYERRGFTRRPDGDRISPEITLDGYVWEAPSPN